MKAFGICGTTHPKTMMENVMWSRKDVGTKIHTELGLFDCSIFYLGKFLIE